jgi:hypothetical protein
MDAPGFLGTGASLKSDLSLLAYVLLIVPVMLVGFFFARRKMFVPHHKLIMTLLIIVNWVIIFALMAISYREGVIPYLDAAFGDPRVALPTIHLVTGLTAQLLGTYLVLRMWLEHILPKWLMVRRIKTYMRFTLALWLVTASLGVIIYATWYVRPVRAENSIPPASTPEVKGTAELSPASTAELAPVKTEDFHPLATQEPCPQATSELNSDDTTPTPCPIATEEISPARTQAVRPIATEDVRPVRTGEIDDDRGDDDDKDDDRGKKNDRRDDDDNSGKGS